MRHISRGGRYLRVADPNWRYPLSVEYSCRRGGRWNPPESFGVIYLNASLGVARAQVLHRLEPRGIRPEDLMPEEGPILIHVDVPEDRFVDALTDKGLISLDLPKSYPIDARGNIVPHSVCQPIGRRIWDAGEPGIACRSAARAAPAGSQELAHFARSPLHSRETESFADWYWAGD